MKYILFLKSYYFEVITGTINIYYSILNFMDWSFETQESYPGATTQQKTQERHYKIIYMQIKMLYPRTLERKYILNDYFLYCWTDELVIHKESHFMKRRTYYIVTNL